MAKVFQSSKRLLCTLSQGSKFECCSLWVLRWSGRSKMKVLCAIHPVNHVLPLSTVRKGIGSEMQIWAHYERKESSRDEQSISCLYDHPVLLSYFIILAADSSTSWNYSSTSQITLKNLLFTCDWLNYCMLVETFVNRSHLTDRWKWTTLEHSYSTDQREHDNQ